MLNNICETAATPVSPPRLPLTALSKHKSPLELIKGYHHLNHRGAHPFSAIGLGPLADP